MPINYHVARHLDLNSITVIFFIFIRFQLAVNIFNANCKSPVLMQTSCQSTQYVLGSEGKRTQLGVESVWAAGGRDGHQAD